MRRATIRTLLMLAAAIPTALAADEPPAIVDASALRGKVLCGYQGWFRCAGDASGLGWIHWSRDANRLTPENLVFDIWPEHRENLDKIQVGEIVVFKYSEAVAVSVKGGTPAKAATPAKKK